MNKDGRAQASHGGARPGPRQRPPIFAALDLGTNNCRLLMAQQNPDGSLKVVDGFSRIVRLGEGLAHTGRLSEGAMSRAYQALAACAQRIEAREPVAVGCVATQACRAAANGQVFHNRIEKDLGLKFEIISAEGFEGSYPTVARWVREQRGPRFRAADGASVPTGSRAIPRGPSITRSGTASSRGCCAG